jgi:hypothetical protein
MTDEHGFDEDPQLRVVLAASDPARSLTPADPTGLARLLEDTMANDLDTRTDLPQQDTELRRRGPLAWLVSAAAVAAIAGGGYAVVASMQDDVVVEQAAPTSPPADRPADNPAGEPVVVALEAPTTLPARCAVPSPEILGSAEIAFAGTVTAVDGDTVTLTPTESYTGVSADEVEVFGMGPDVRALGVQPEFVVGGTYLVSATDGQMSVCGLSGEVSPELENLYELAFR